MDGSSSSHNGILNFYAHDRSTIEGIADARMESLTRDRYFPLKLRLCDLLFP